MHQVEPFHPVNSTRYPPHRPGAWTPRSKVSSRPSQPRTWISEIVTSERERWNSRLCRGGVRRTCLPFQSACFSRLKKKKKNAKLSPIQLERHLIKLARRRYFTQVFSTAQMQFVCTPQRQCTACYLTEVSSSRRTALMFSCLPSSHCREIEK